jgi:surface antigen
MTKTNLSTGQYSDTECYGFSNPSRFRQVVWQGGSLQAGKAVFITPYEQGAAVSSPTDKKVTL